MWRRCIVCGATFLRRSYNVWFCSEKCHLLRIEKNFWSHVVKIPNGCWIWTGGTSTGYGSFAVHDLETGTRITVLAHRLSYEFAFGPIEDDLDVCHSCDNRRCVKPAHLFLGTDTDNMQDAKAKGRTARGERSRPKLSVDEVLEIRRGCAEGKTQVALALVYNVDISTISDIVHRKTWKRV